MSNKSNKRLNLEFFWSVLASENMCFSVLGTFPMGWNSSFSWAWPELIPGHWEGLLGLVTSLGSSLDARHSPWAFGQLGKAPGPWPGWIQLEKPGEGWTRLLGLSGPWMDTLALTEHSDTHSFQNSWLNPESAVFGDFGTFWALHIFWQFWHILVKLAHFAVLAISGPTLATKMSQGLLGLCCSM